MHSAETFASYPSLRDRLIVITGGASGIGEAIVEAFAVQNSRVVFLDIQDSPAEHLIRRIDSAGFTAPIFYHCDLTDIASLEEVMGKVLGSFAAVDVLVNNAGNDGRHSIEEVSSAYWDQSMAVNLKHQFFMAKSVIPGMKKAGRGSIINMSSIGWVIPSTNLPVYVTAKAAIVASTTWP